ncbi:MAG: Vms1/Ankzf1 family peptidyl-tRNA hydrolase [Haloarculaceae archaeon]
MLDDLLGRTELRERIEELEEENHHLERQLSAEQERRAEAVSARQDAEERVNRLEDHIADLEGRLAGGDDRDGLTFRAQRDVRGARCAEVLDRLGTVATDAEGALTAMVADDVPDAVGDALGDRAALVSRAAPCLVVADDAGLVAAALDPPVAPDPFCTWGEGFALEREWFLPEGRYALALVRADLFALGEYEGGERLAFEGFESDVKGDHSKGGFSQARFERIRDDQIDAHLDRCREAIADRDAETLYVVGHEQLLGEFDADATAAVDATGAPADALDHAAHDFWTTRVFGL